MNIDQLKLLLQNYNLTPNKLRGQNFLVSDEVLEDIINLSGISKNDLVLEVGPGFGALTQKLSTVAKQVIALEIDQNFFKPLNKLIKLNPNIEIIWQDILSLTELRWQEILTQHKVSDYKIVANIPYYLTGKFIKKFLTAKKKPSSMTLMVQQEVAKRAVDLKKSSLLSLSIAFYAKSTLAALVNKNNFYPKPKVDSAILYIYDIKNWSYDADEKKTWSLIKRGFAFKRKKLFNNLLTDPQISRENLTKVFDKFHLDLNIRAEKLTVNDWINIAKSL